MLSVGSLFSGIGGFDLGFERAGMQCVWQCEIDSYCIRVLEKHWPDVLRVSDIKEVSAMPASKLTAEQFEVALQSYRDGESVGAIADHLPITRQALWERFKRAGVEMREQKRHGSDNHFYRGGAKGADWAHNKVESALKRGEITRPDNCEQCGGEGIQYRDGRGAIQAHHDDYNEPLKIRWLCKECHHAWHEEHEPIALREVMPKGSLPPVDVLCGGFP